MWRLVSQHQTWREAEAWEVDALVAGLAVDLASVVDSFRFGRSHGIADWTSDALLSVGCEANIRYQQSQKLCRHLLDAKGIVGIRVNKMSLHCVMLRAYLKLVSFVYIDSRGDRFLLKGLYEHLFTSLPHAKVMIEHWRRENNGGGLNHHYSG